MAVKGFLEQVASDLYARYGDSLSEKYILFPSQRARRFFVDALSREVKRPLWQPHWVSIDDLMSEISGLRVGDRLRLIVELYKVYSVFHPKETFDKFYFWGDMLLMDFDTIDKYGIDARQLLRNLSEIKEIEADISYLTEEQLKIVRFWSSFGDKSGFSEEKRRFVALWDTLYDIYVQFRERLSQLGIAYNGMVQRAAAERLKEGAWTLPEGREYVIAGFNALSECEKQLFKFLANNTLTDFYWDYDDYYIDNHEQEAGMFLRENILSFPPCTRFDTQNMARPKEVREISTVSNAVQCKYVAKILEELLKSHPEGLDKETAIVLTDENLLMPLLYSLPKEAGKVNVTMGYPLKQALAYTFVERLLQLQSHRRRRDNEQVFYHVDVEGILSHPYVSIYDEELSRDMCRMIVQERRITVPLSSLACNPLYRALFAVADDRRSMSEYLLRVIDAVAEIPYMGDDANRRKEFLAVLAEEIEKLSNSLDECDIELSPEIYSSLLRRHLQTVRIPFEGEPLQGIQVMGILETRNLDFENVIILSMNDDNFPGNNLAQASFIPYNLRSAFAMPTPEHHEGVYAYYFYRLIQRAKRLFMLYSSMTDEKSVGEPSRYIRQLDYESSLVVNRVEVGVDVNLVADWEISVEKDDAVMEELMKFTQGDGGRRMSPSAFTTYVTCPLKFYFRYIAGIKPRDEELKEEVDSAMFGTIFHAAAETLYRGVLNEEHPGEQLRRITSAQIEAAVRGAINEHYLCDRRSTENDYTGELLLVKSIVERYISALIRYDAAHDDFATTGLEKVIKHDFPFLLDGQTLNMRFEGRADRIDSLDGGPLRVVDYKTGASQSEFKGIEALFDSEEPRNQSSNVLQALLYSMILFHDCQREVLPTLYYVRYISSADYSPLLVDRGGDDEENKDKGKKRGKEKRGCLYSEYREKFEGLLEEKIGELFNRNLPFLQCTQPDSCEYCDFNVLCKRK